MFCEPMFWLMGQLLSISSLLLSISSFMGCDWPDFERFLEHC